MSDYSIWPDDTARALRTWILVGSGGNTDHGFDDVMGSIENGAQHSGRPVEYAIELVNVFTEGGAGVILQQPQVIQLLRQKLAQAQMREDEMRSRGEWRDDNDNEKRDNDHG